jgi:hypothetical protein
MLENQPMQPMQPMQPINQTINIKGQNQNIFIMNWSEYYTCKKPHCISCLQAGIKEGDYRFCSEGKAAPDNYKCIVKH